METWSKAGVSRCYHPTANNQWQILQWYRSHCFKPRHWSSSWGVPVPVRTEERWNGCSHPCNASRWSLACLYKIMDPTLLTAVSEIRPPAAASRYMCISVGGMHLYHTRPKTDILPTAVDIEPRGMWSNAGQLFQFCCLALVLACVPPLFCLPLLPFIHFYNLNYCLIS